MSLPQEKQQTTGFSAGKTPQAGLFQDTIVQDIPNHRSEHPVWLWGIFSGQATQRVAEMFDELLTVGDFLFAPTSYTWHGVVTPCVGVKWPQLYTHLLAFFGHVHELWLHLELAGGALCRTPSHPYYSHTTIIPESLEVWSFFWGGGG